MTRDEAIAAVKEVFPDAKVVERKEEPRDYALWERKWERDEAQLQDYSKMGHPFRFGLKAVQDEGRKFALYCMFCTYVVDHNIRVTALRKRPRKEGWAAVAYHAQHNEWPPRKWNDLIWPGGWKTIRLRMDPDKDAMVAIHAHEAMWKAELRRRKQEEEEDGPDGSVEEREAADEVQQSEEGAG